MSRSVVMLVINRSWVQFPPRQNCVTTFGKLFTPMCLYVTKQYNLVLVKGRWCSLAGKVTAGLAESNGSLLLGDDLKSFLIVRNDTCRHRVVTEALSWQTSDVVSLLPTVVYLATMWNTLRGSVSECRTCRRADGRPAGVPWLSWRSLRRFHTHATEDDQLPSRPTYSRNSWQHDEITNGPSSFF